MNTKNNYDKTNELRPRKRYIETIDEMNILLARTTMCFGEYVGVQTKYPVGDMEVLTTDSSSHVYTKHWTKSWFRFDDPNIRWYYL